MESANSFEAKFRRILKAIGDTNESELARILGIHPSSVGSAKKRQQIPTGWVELIAEKYGVSADWLFFGRGSMRPDENVGPQAITDKGVAEPPDPYGDDDPEFAKVPKVEARLSAGGGSFEVSDQIVGYYKFRKGFLKRKGDPSQMVLMDVAGDSMEPDLWEGDTVLIDKSQTKVIVGKIYAVGIDEEVVVKYLDKEPGKLILVSKNPSRKPIEVDVRGDLADQVRILGRVIWWCREAK